MHNFLNVAQSLALMETIGVQPTSHIVLNASRRWPDHSSTDFNTLHINVSHNQRTNCV